MTDSTREDAPLGHCRVLDLTDDKAFLCGRILGDMGADVIKVEPPGGEPSRRIGPFYSDDPNPEKSLHWFAFNASKRGITLNIESVDGKEIFRKLVKTADIVVESFAPGHMAGLGLDYDALSKVNPAVIVTSVTPFGQSGPYRDFKGPDIVVWALSGVMSLCGDEDRAPVRSSFGQSAMHAGAGAATASLVALYHREMTGEGQHVDVSMLEASVPAMLSNRLFWDLNRKNLKRGGPYRVGMSARAKQRLIWRCQDGYVSFLLLGGGIGEKTNRALVQWMAEEELAPDHLKAKDWATFDQGQVTQEVIDQIETPINAFFLKHTKAELYDGAIKRHIQLYPVYTAEELAKDAQLNARGFWVDVPHQELCADVAYAGSFAKLSATPVRISRRAPLIGEHNEEVYIGELGYSTEQLVILKQAGVI